METGWNPHFEIAPAPDMPYLVKNSSVILT